MKVTTDTELRRTIAQRWLAHYGPRCRSIGRSEPFLQEVQGERLKALGNDPTVEQIADIIGKAMAEGWTKLVCSECERYVAAVVEFPSPGDYMEKAEVCADCLHEALRLLGEDRAGHWTPWEKT